jgi:hypothetical protein
VIILTKKVPDQWRYLRPQDEHGGATQVARDVGKFGRWKGYGSPSPIKDVTKRILRVQP